MGVQRNRRIAQSSFHAPVADVFRAVFETNDRSYERVASSFNVGDISVAALAIPERLADGGHVDSKAPFLNGYVRPDVIHQLLLRDNLAWVVGKIGQNIQRPIPERKRSTVAPEHPLANRKFKRAELQLPVNCVAMHVCQPNVGSISPALTFERTNYPWYNLITLNAESSRLPPLPPQ